MRIALQKSGGRGEYELTGASGQVTASSLENHALSFEVRPDLEIDARSEARRAQGKLRIRLTQASNAKHAYLVFSDMLLLPVPIREWAKTTNEKNFVRKRAYAITDIDVDLLSHRDAAAVLRPTRLWLQNRVDDVREVDFAERLAIVQAVWHAARGAQGRHAALIQAHDAAVEAGDHDKIAAAAKAVRANYEDVDSDVLPLLAAEFKLDLDPAVAEGGVPVPWVGDEALQDDTDPAEAQRRSLITWRKQAARGAAGRRFSESVKAAYEYRCAFCGGRFPKLQSSATSGVDGAHILPWAKYDLNSVVNGLCLCKTCHWAFDNGLLRLDCRASKKQYLLSVPKSVKPEAKAVQFDLSRFEDLVGPLAKWKLPESEALWPSPKYLAELNRLMYG